MDFFVTVMAYYGVGIIIGLVVQGICHSRVLFVRYHSSNSQT